MRIFNMDGIGVVLRAHGIYDPRLSKLLEPCLNKEAKLLLCYSFVMALADIKKDPLVLEKMYTLARCARIEDELIDLEVLDGKNLKFKEYGVLSQ